ncbi:hypothetical protein EWW49_32095, partial [Pseudomonas syringae]
GGGGLRREVPRGRGVRAEGAGGGMGRGRRHAEPALAMRKGEGGRWRGDSDVVEGGATSEAATDNSRAIAESQVLVLARGVPGEDATPYLIHNRKRESRRITAPPARVAAGSLVFDALTSKRLYLHPAASGRAVTLDSRSQA